MPGLEQSFEKSEGKKEKHSSLLAAVGAASLCLDIPAKIPMQVTTLNAKCKC